MVVLRSHEETAKELLERLRRVQVAREGPPTTWRSRVRDVTRIVLLVAGGLMLYKAAESLPNGWMLLNGGWLLVCGLSFRDEAPSDRLEALIRFLDRKGQLTVPDSGIRNKPPA